MHSFREGPSEIEFGKTGGILFLVVVAALITIVVVYIAELLS